MDVFGQDSISSNSQNFKVERNSEPVFLGYYPGEEGKIDLMLDLRGEIYFREDSDHQQEHQDSETYFEKFLDEVEELEPGFDRTSVEQIAEEMDYGGDRYD